MLKKMFLTCLFLLISCQKALTWIDLNSLYNNQKIVTAAKQIQFEDFPNAHNPSLIKNDQGFLLTFRYVPDFYGQTWISYIGIVQLDESLEPVSQPTLLNTRCNRSRTPSQAEDARFFFYRNRLFLIYNDNVEVVEPGYWDRRDMFIAELIWAQDHYELSSPLKLYYEQDYSHRLWQKNWTPFEYDDKLFFAYAINPHVILHPNLITGACFSFYDTALYLDWKFGQLRGSSQALFVDGEYLSFFHSGIYDNSEVSWSWGLFHYFMGAYTFSAKPPFQITSMTPSPIIADGFYAHSNREKRVIFPGGVCHCWFIDLCRLWP
jgi:hypothetical protein